MSQRKIMNSVGGDSNNGRRFTEDDYKDPVVIQETASNVMSSLPWSYKIKQAEQFSSEEPSEQKVSFRNPANVS